MLWEGQVFGARPGEVILFSPITAEKKLLTSARYWFRLILKAPQLGPE